MRKMLAVMSVVLIIIISFSCKKKNTDPPPPNSSTSTSTSVPTIGFLGTSYIYFDQVSAGGGITVDSSASARFNESQSSSTTVNAGTVTLNGVMLDNFSNSYSNPSSPIINITSTQNWNVTGSGTLTAFNHSFQPYYPKYIGGNLLPDTCVKANGITINISGVTNSPPSPLVAAPIVVQIQQGSVFLYKYFSGLSGTVNFSATEIAGMTTGSFVNITVSIQNYKLETFGAIGHQFNNSLLYYKYSYLK